MTVIYFYIYCIFQAPAILIHELSHWIVAQIGSIFGLCDEVTLDITRYPSIEKNNIGSYNIYETSAQCSYVTYGDSFSNDLLILLTSIAPLFMTIYLYWIAYSFQNWYIFGYVTYHLPTFLPSTTDTEQTYDRLGRILNLWH